nr:hypothetical protein [Kibdelosporangium sp. MJ126-NF4]
MWLLVFWIGFAGPDGDGATSSPEVGSRSRGGEEVRAQWSD